MARRRGRDPFAIFRSVLLLSSVGIACAGSADEPSQPGTSSGGTSTSGGNANWCPPCKSGKLSFDASYCCSDPAKCPSGTTQDAGACRIDCEKVCKGATGFLAGACREEEDGGTISYACGGCGCGRLPADTKAGPDGETIADRVARQAYYEGVSAVAFERLAAVLRASDAPEDLVARAFRAAEDEARHATIFADLARAYGATVPATELAMREPSLFDLALENATEGCVRETLGAAITLHQSMHARSRDLRDAFAAIARDEAEHSALSWDLRAWFDTRLDEADRARIDIAHRAALEAARVAMQEVPDAPGVALGLPPPGRARRMLELSVEAMAG